eukprot:jgi/Botrbrau1/15053/Bobra.118_2s0001.1
MCSARDLLQSAPSPPLVRQNICVVEIQPIKRFSKPKPPATNEASDSEGKTAILGAHCNQKSTLILDLFH